MQSDTYTYNKYLKYKIKYALRKYELHGGGYCNEEMLKEIQNILGNIKLCSKNAFGITDTKCKEILDDNLRLLHEILNKCAPTDTCMTGPMPNITGNTFPQEWEKEKFKTFWCETPLFRQVWRKYHNFLDIWIEFQDLQEIIYNKEILLTRHGQEVDAFLWLFYNDAEFRRTLLVITGVGNHTYISGGISSGIYEGRLILINLFCNTDKTKRKQFISKLTDDKDYELFREQFYRFYNFRALYSLPKFQDIWEITVFQNTWKTNLMLRELFYRYNTYTINNGKITYDNFIVSNCADIIDLLEDNRKCIEILYDLTRDHFKLFLVDPTFKTALRNSKCDKTKLLAELKVESYKLYYERLGFRAARVQAQSPSLGASKVVPPSPLLDEFKGISPSPPLDGSIGVALSPQSGEPIGVAPSPLPGGPGV
jgi:hypothetical protein